MSDHPVRYNRLKRILTTFDITCDEARGRGSEVLCIHRPTGRRHVIGKHGQNPEIPRAVVAALRRKFRLKPAHDVSDDEFYRRG